LFQLVNVSRCLRQLKPLQGSPARRIGAKIAIFSGAGKLGAAALQSRAPLARWNARDLRIEPVSQWGDWVDELWHRHRRNYSFAVRRDLRTVENLYRLDTRTRAFLFRRGATIVGWMSALLTSMRNDQYFGDLRVATVMDGIVDPELLSGAIALTSQALAQDGADILLTNQSHHGYAAAFRKAGYLSSKSNYILALSKSLTNEIASQPGGLASVHFTRGDSDGRMNL
jgi:hypothetical protein